MYHYVGEGDAGGELEGVVAVGHAARQVECAPHIPSPDRSAGQQAATVTHAA